MEPSALPAWAQAVFYIVIAIGSAGVGIFSYFKKKVKDEPPSVAGPTKINASFIDSKLLKELVEALREIQEEMSRDTKKSHRLLQELREAINELNESTIVQTDTTMNLVRFITRQTNKDRLVDAREKYD